MGHKMYTDGLKSPYGERPCRPSAMREIHALKMLIKRVEKQRPEALYGNMHPYFYRRWQTMNMIVKARQDPKLVHVIYEDLDKVVGWNKAKLQGGTRLSPRDEIVSAAETINIADPDHEHIQSGFHLVQFEALKSKKLSPTLQAVLIC